MSWRADAGVGPDVAPVSVTTPYRAPASRGPGPGTLFLDPPPRPEIVGPAAVDVGDAPEVLARSWLLMDLASGRTIAARHPRERRAVASTQKMLTALLVLERGSLNAPVTIRSGDTAVEPSKVGLRSGQTISRGKLLEAILVKSGNDAAMALARDHSGSVENFAEAMTRRARELGAYDSRFLNPHGLTEPGQYSTAHDLARIARTLFRWPLVRQFARQRSVTVNGRTFDATNKLLKRMPECTGLKTGYTIASGRCLVSTARIGGRDLLLVQLGSKESVIWADAERLMRWGRSQL